MSKGERDDGGQTDRSDHEGNLCAGTPGKYRAEIENDNVLRNGLVSDRWGGQRKISSARYLYVYGRPGKSISRC